MDKLADWPKVLYGFKDMLEKCTRSVKLVSTQHQDTAPLRLLRFISRNASTKSYTAIESNFLYAAMHLACMQELRFSMDTCPDLPDNLEALIDT